MNEASDGGGEGAREGKSYLRVRDFTRREMEEWTTAAGRREEGARERASELRRRARRRGGKKVSAQKMPNAPSAFHNSYFLPSFALRYPYPPLPLASRRTPPPPLFSFPLPVSSIRPPRPSPARPWPVY